MTQRFIPRTPESEYAGAKVVVESINYWKSQLSQKSSIYSRKDIIESIKSNEHSKKFYIYSLKRMKKGNLKIIFSLKKDLSKMPKKKKIWVLKKECIDELEKKVDKDDEFFVYFMNLAHFDKKNYERKEITVDISDRDLKMKNKEELTNQNERIDKYLKILGSDCEVSHIRIPKPFLLNTKIT